MIRIGVTGSISSGKSSFAKMLAQKKYPIFNADLIVTKLYKKKHIITSLKKKFRLKNKNQKNTNYFSLTIIYNGF